MEQRPVPIYIRVSSEDQVLGTSLETQLRDCRAAAVREGFAVGEVFADEGESAKTIEGRPAFLRLLEHIKEERPPAVVVWKIDRLARNNLHAQIVRSKLSAAKCRLISATEPISDDPSGKFMFDVLSAVAEYDNRLRAERVRAGMTAQRAAGWWVSTPPVGYVAARTEQNKPTLAPDPVKAPLVLEAYRLTASGAAQTSIINLLASKGLVTRSGKPLPKESMSHLLSNRAYIAEGTEMSDVKGNVRGKWPAIVPEDLWYRVQAMHGKGKVPRLSGGDFPLKGVLVCAECGKPLTGSFSRGKRGDRYGYYHCPRNHVRAPVPAVEQALAGLIAGLAMRKQAVDDLERMIKGMMAKDFPAKSKVKEKARRKLAAIEEQLDRLVQLHLTDGISRARYDAKRGDLEWKLLAARADYTAADTEKMDVFNEFNRARQLLLDPGAFWTNATPSERAASFPLFFDTPLKMSMDKKIRTPLLQGSNCPIWWS